MESWAIHYGVTQMNCISHPVSTWKVEQFIVVVAQMNCISHSVQLEKLDSLLCGGTNKLY